MSSAENGKPAGRLVLLTDVQRALIRGEARRCKASGYPEHGRMLREISDAWDAAPADPVEAVFLALGVPSSSPTRSDNPPG